MGRRPTFLCSSAKSFWHIAALSGVCARIKDAQSREDSMQEIGHWINGKMVAGTSGRFADVMNPATGEVQAKVALATQTRSAGPAS
jgi:hypothetical protein